MTDVNHERYLLEHEIVNRLHRYAAKGQCAAANEMKTFENLVCNMLPDFYAFVEKKNLTDQEAFVCYLTRLRFIPTEIASLLGLSKQRVSNMRSNINKKVFRAVGTKSFTANIYRV